MGATNSEDIQSPVDILFEQLIRLLQLLVIGTVLAACSTQKEVVKEPRKPQREVSAPEAPFILTDIPPTPREFRGAWIATVDNIDWPSKPGLPVFKQKAELRAMFDRAELLNMNAIIFQVRTSADALYRSPYEPWSEYLTGKQSVAPEPFYDPLKFAIAEAHRRGLELHAWFNPFRAYHPSMEGKLAENHISKTHPEMVVRYGDYFWLDPGLKSVRQYSIDVIADVVRRYDIDGVHLDDYFYPYPVQNNAGAAISFPDEDSYASNFKLQNKLPRNAWRRENVNRFVKRLYEEIKLIDPHVRFGIAPFGIWRPGYPEQIEGFDAFDRIFADARKWLQKGWVDYLSPQLYWPIDQERQSFPVLLEWWAQQNVKNRHIWPGVYTSRLQSSSEGWSSDEIERQIQLIQHQEGATGAIHFSMTALMQNPDSVAGDLLTKEYHKPALVPASGWISETKPPKPSVKVQKIGDRYTITPYISRSSIPWLWVVKKKYGDCWQIDIYPGWRQSIALPADSKKGKFKGATISIVNEVGNEGSPQRIKPKR